jgi:hypothetical protein
MQATYTKLKSGDWGLRVTEGNPKSGEYVQAIKKSGEKKHEQIGKILWSGNGVSLCTIRRSEPSYDRGSSRTSVERLYMRKYGWDGRRDSTSYYTSGMYDEES